MYGSTAYTGMTANRHYRAAGSQPQSSQLHVIWEKICQQTKRRGRRRVRHCRCIKFRGQLGIKRIAVLCALLLVLMLHELGDSPKSHGPSSPAIVGWEDHTVNAAAAAAIATVVTQNIQNNKHQKQEAPQADSTAWMQKAAEQLRGPQSEHPQEAHAHDRADGALDISHAAAFDSHRHDGDSLDISARDSKLQRKVGFVESMYSSLLCRAGESWEVAFKSMQLRKKEITKSQMIFFERQDDEYLAWTEGGNSENECGACSALCRTERTAETDRCCPQSKAEVVKLGPMSSEEADFCLRFLLQPCHLAFVEAEAIRAAELKAAAKQANQDSRDRLAAKTKATAKRRKANEEFVHRLYKAVLCRDGNDHHKSAVDQLNKGDFTRFGIIAHIRQDGDYKVTTGGSVLKECGKCSAECGAPRTSKSDKCCSIDTDPSTLSPEEDFFCSMWVTTICKPKDQVCVNKISHPAIPPQVEHRLITNPDGSKASAKTARQWPSKPTMYVLSGSETRWNSFEKPPWANVIRHVPPRHLAPKQTEWFCLPWMINFMSKSKWPSGTLNVAAGHVQIWLRVIAECKGWCLVSEDDIGWPKQWNVSALASVPAGNFTSMSMDTRGMLEPCLAELDPADPLFRQIMHLECEIGRSKYNRMYDAKGKTIYRKDTGYLYGTGAYAMTADAAVAWINALPFRAPVDHHMWRVAVDQGTGLVPRFFETKHYGRSSVKESRDFGRAKNVRVGAPKLGKGLAVDALGLGKYG
jgi:hypothetical protein